jgi:hypothetical protein
MTTMMVMSCVLALGTGLLAVCCFTLYCDAAAAAAADDDDDEEGVERISLYRSFRLSVLITSGRNENSDDSPTYLTKQF